MQTPENVVALRARIPRASCGVRIKSSLGLLPSPLRRIRSFSPTPTRHQGFAGSGQHPEPATPNRPIYPSVASRTRKKSKRTRTITSEGTATITPTMPPRPPPTITARKTRTGR
jgi:hypothetical protein